MRLRAIPSRLSRFIVRLVVVWAVFYSVFSLYGSWMVRKEIAKLRGSGHPVDIRTLCEPGIPDSRNGAVLFEKAFEEIWGRTDDIHDISAVGYDEFKAERSRYRHILPLIEQAVEKPQCRFPIQYYPDPSKVVSPYYTKMHCIAELPRASAHLAAEDGRIDEAINCLELSLQIGHTRPESEG